MQSEVSDNGVPASILGVEVRCELLCFVQQKMKIMPSDDLVKLCSDFYKKEEIMAARSSLDLHLSKRLPKRQGTDMCRATVEDIVKVCLDPRLRDPNVQLPNFYAMDITRLPPVDATHCDMSAVLHELQLLRREVREVGLLKAEVDMLKSELHQLRRDTDETAQLRSEIDVMKKEMQRMRCESMETATLMTSDHQTLVLPSHGPTTASVTDDSNNGWSRIVRRLRTDEGRLRQGLDDNKHATSNRPKAIFGNSKSNTRVKSVVTRRTIDVFVSRLDPDTDAPDIIECAKDIIGDLIPDSDVIRGVKLNSKFPHLYSSYHISVTVDTCIMSACIDRLMSIDGWPVGVLVKRYFPPKNG